MRDDGQKGFKVNDNSVPPLPAAPVRSIQVIEGRKYPKSVFFIISSEFCERFSFFSMRNVLPLYLTSVLKFSEDSASVLYHAHVMLCFLFPVFGAILADSFLGKFKTILYLSIVYAIGNLLLSVAAVPVIPLPRLGISLLALLLIAIGTGGIKPCVSSFGGDQFVVPEQCLQLQQFFSLFYFSINVGGMLSTWFAPILRHDVKCFGQNSCYSLAFGAPAILFIIALVIFVVGKRRYIMKEPRGNVIVIFVKCIWHALKNKTIRKNNAKKDYWLEYADDKYSKQQIADTRAVLNVLCLFLPVPLYWALYDQQGSRWIFQATNMDGRLFSFTIKPDQMHIINPILILILIPIFETFVYPALKTVGIKTPLQKMVIGGFLAALSYVCSAVLESYVADSYGVQSVPGMGQLRIFNNLNCNVTLNPSIENVFNIAPVSHIELLHIPVKHKRIYSTTLNVDNSCSSALGCSAEITVNEKKIVSYFITEYANALAVQSKRKEKLSKDNDGSAQIRFFSNYNGTARLVDSGNQNTEQLQEIYANTVTDFILISPGRYDLMFNNEKTLNNLVLNPGEIDTILLHQNANNTVQSEIINMVPSNKVHMLWQVPQFIVITLAEIMFAITGLEFSFTQAPPSMNSVLSAAWLLTTTFGNLIVVVISKIKFFNSQTYEFLLFAVLMVFDVLWFIVLAMRYKYVSYNNGS